MTLQLFLKDSLSILHLRTWQEKWKCVWVDPLVPVTGQQRHGEGETGQQGEAGVKHGQHQQDVTK